MKRFFTTIKATIAALLLVAITAFAPVATAGATPTGNNGTLKVHEIGTPSATENNDPKVCAFNFEGFGFDPSQSGYILLTTQGGSQPVGQNAGPFGFGPVNNNGYAISQDFNTAGGTTIVNGTYKATLYGKDTGGQLNLQDEKAKSKVFKVECAATPPKENCDVCANIPGDQKYAPEGTVLDGNGNCITPGRGGEETPPTPTPTTPVVVASATTQPAAQTTAAPAALVDTGLSTKLTTAIAATIIALATAVAVFGGRKDLLARVARATKLAVQR